MMFLLNKSEPRKICNVVMVLGFSGICKTSPSFPYSFQDCSFRLIKLNMPIKDSMATDRPTRVNHSL